MSSSEQFTLNEHRRIPCRQRYPVLVVDERLTVQELVLQKGLPPDRVVVELNETIITRSLWGKTRLKDGDRLELVRFVGGG